MTLSVATAVLPNAACAASGTSVTGTADTTATRCIAWVDVSCLTRDCLTHAVARAQRLFMIVPFASVYECTRFSDRKLDLIVYHSHAPDTVSLADILALRGAFSSVQIVVLSDATTMDPGVIREVLAQGASGFILTNQTGLQMVVSALSLVASGGTFVPKEFLFTKRPAADSATEPKASKLRHLTPRELDVLALIKQGKPNKEIARLLDMSPSTVKVHARSLMRKTGAANRVQLAINADKQIRQD